MLLQKQLIVRPPALPRLPRMEWYGVRNEPAEATLGSTTDGSVLVETGPQPALVMGAPVFSWNVSSNFTQVEKDLQYLQVGVTMG